MCVFAFEPFFIHVQLRVVVKTVGKLSQRGEVCSKKKKKSQDMSSIVHLIEREFPLFFCAVPQGGCVLVCIVIACLWILH